MKMFKCKDGYKDLNGEDMSENPICTPVCTSGCEHGNCVAPEQCKCSKGYANDKNE